MKRVTSEKKNVKGFIDGDTGERNGGSSKKRMGKITPGRQNLERLAYG